MKGSGFRVDKFDDIVAEFSSKFSVLELTTVDNFARV